MTKRRVPDLIIESASDTGNFFYLGLIEYRKENYLVVVDNITDDEVYAYVLDYAQQEGINVKELLSTITYWFYRGSHTYPLSFEFSRLGISQVTNRIYKSFELTHVTRLVGKDFRYDMDKPPKVRRRRASRIPAGFEVKLKRAASPY